MLAAAVIRDIRRVGLPASSVVPLGSLRRCAPDVGDVSLLAVATPDRHRDVLSGFAKVAGVTSITGETTSSVTALTGRGQVTLRVAAPEHAGAALVWHTGSRQHTIQLQSRARRAGLRLGARGLERASGGMVQTASEGVLYRHLDLPHIAPELREGDGEIEAAERGALPSLVSDLHMRGDLHMHTTWSDGRDSLRDMVLAGKQLGYEYVAITDHSERAMCSRKLSAADVPRQREEIETLRSQIAGIQILHGIEVDIMHDGSLDFDDTLLEQFDIVLASLHDHGGHDGAWLTERYLRAIRHPLVNVITHPANRSPAYSDGYALEFDRLFAAAAETGTAMEIDGAPGHLDMDGTRARQAVAAGVTVAIDSDCHRVDALGRQMRFGLGMARRGWVEPRHVLNTQDVHGVRAFVARKRAGR